jgi:hypothetical protein
MTVNKRYDVVWPQSSVGTVSWFGDHVGVGFHRHKPGNNLVFGKHSLLLGFLGFFNFFATFVFGHNLLLVTYSMRLFDP